MNHFDITQWTDFARGVTPDAARCAMEAHVESGCVRCRQTLDLLERVFLSARVQSQHEPPAHVVRCAKALGTLLLPRPSRLSRLVAHLVYDSLGDAAPAGMRAEDRVSRHGVYEVGDFHLDVRVEQEKGSSLATLVGQLTNRAEPDSPMPEAPVLLMTRQAIVAHALYNRFGEFQMDYPPAPHLRLRVALALPGKRLELSLKRLISEMPAVTYRGKARSRKQGRTPLS